MAEPRARGVGRELPARHVTQSSRRRWPADAKEVARRRFHRVRNRPFFHHRRGHPPPFSALRNPTERRSISRRIRGRRPRSAEPSDDAAAGGRSRTVQYAFRVTGNASHSLYRHIGDSIRAGPGWAGLRSERCHRPAIPTGHRRGTEGHADSDSRKSGPSPQARDFGPSIEEQCPDDAAAHHPPLHRTSRRLPRGPSRTPTRSHPGTGQKRGDRATPWTLSVATLQIPRPLGARTPRPQRAPQPTGGRKGDRNSQKRDTALYATGTVT